MTGAMAPTKPLNANDLCDRCGAPAYVRVILPGSAELLFCAHHNRQHAPALAKVAVEIHDETATAHSQAERGLNQPLTQPARSAQYATSQGTARRPHRWPAAVLFRLR